MPLKGNHVLGGHLIVDLLLGDFAATHNADAVLDPLDRTDTIGLGKLLGAQDADPGERRRERRLQLERDQLQEPLLRPARYLSGEPRLLQTAPSLALRRAGARRR